jgi:hypothetical protein
LLARVRSCSGFFRQADALLSEREMVVAILAHVALPPKARARSPAFDLT